MKLFFTPFTNVNRLLRYVYPRIRYRVALLLSRLSCSTVSAIFVGHDKSGIPACNCVYNITLFMGVNDLDEGRSHVVSGSWAMCF